MILIVDGFYKNKAAISIISRKVNSPFKVIKSKQEIDHVVVKIFFNGMQETIKISNVELAVELSKEGKQS